MKTTNNQTTNQTQKSLFLPLVVTLDNYESILDEHADLDLWDFADDLSILEYDLTSRVQVSAYLHRMTTQYREVASNYKVNLKHILAWDLKQTLKSLNDE